MRSVVLVAVLLVAACGGTLDKPPRTNADVVPVNSAAEARLSGTSPKAGADVSTSSAPPPPDPTRPYVVRVGDKPVNRDALKTPDPSEAKPAGDPSDRISAAECDAVFEKFTDLQVSQNPALRGASPDVRKILRKDTRNKRREADCKATKAQYTCAMGASTVAAWQKCMK